MASEPAAFSGLEHGIALFGLSGRVGLRLAYTSLQCDQRLIGFQVSMREIYEMGSRGRSASPHAAAALTLALGALLGGARPASAHHAFAAEYDGDKPIEITGYVTKAKWVNPHGRLLVDSMGKDGSVTNWTFEFGAPNVMEGAGLNKGDLAPGAKVTVKGFLSKNGGPFGYSVTLILADGRAFKTGGAPDAPAPNSNAGPATGRP